jgi:hypothetical protein
MEKRKFLTLPGLELRPLSSPARSQSLYRCTKTVVFTYSIMYIHILWHYARTPEQWSQNRRSLLGNDSVNTFLRQRIRKQQSNNFRCYAAALKTGLPKNREAIFSAWSVQNDYKEGFSWENLVEFRDASLPGFELGNREIELSWQLQNNDKKVITLCEEDFMCDLKRPWDCYKSVATIRLMKTEKPNACVAVNCNVCRSAIAL